VIDATIGTGTVSIAIIAAIVVTVVIPVIVVATICMRIAIVAIRSMATVAVRIVRTIIEVAIVVIIALRIVTPIHPAATIGVESLVVGVRGVGEGHPLTTVVIGIRGSPHLIAVYRPPSPIAIVPATASSPPDPSSGNPIGCLGDEIAAVSRPDFPSHPARGAVCISGTVIEITIATPLGRGICSCQAQQEEGYQR
jgi:hypothetical protein